MPSEQMYKVYVNGVPVFLGTPESVGEMGLLPAKDILAAPYIGKKKQIRQVLDFLDKNKNTRAVALFAEKSDRLWADFCACFQLLEAAGGFVTNPAGELLVFYRRGSWDMPKGKIDPGETPEQAAVREVQEETGLQQLELGPLLLHTWHTYSQKGDRILKRTWWYRMATSDEQLIPQTEEDIEDIQWVEPRTWLAGKPVVYGSILDVIQAGLFTIKY
ncbi:MAG: NUDIX domain-containing protein [Saprospiraceae bacterium]|nr:NUDIX domain-containing protein [Saprospiraceae bacterium]